MMRLGTSMAAIAAIGLQTLTHLKPKVVNNVFAHSRNRTRRDRMQRRIFASIRANRMPSYMEAPIPLYTDPATLTKAQNKILNRRRKRLALLNRS